MMESWTSYPKIHALGHPATTGITDGDVTVEEKIDGSQISFGVDDDGTLRIRSKGADILPDAPEKMFALGVEQIQRQAKHLVRGWTYRGEYLRTSKHNALAYERIPNCHIILFDIATGQEMYLSYEGKLREAERLGLECVPLLWTGRVESTEQLQQFLERISVLGVQLIEGVVLKPVNYDVFGRDDKPLMAKYVSEKYKEVQAKAWKQSNPGGKDIIGLLADRLRTKARWEKAVQHLRDAGTLVGEVQDIGPLIKEIQRDVMDEEAEAIKDALFRWAASQVSRKVVAGVAEWYKERLAEQHFARTEGALK